MGLNYIDMQNLGVFVLSSLIIFAFFSQTAFSVQSESISKTYQNSLYDIYLKYPEEWVYSERQAPDCGMWFSFCVIFYQTGSDITKVVPINPFNIIHLGILRPNLPNLEQVYSGIIQTNQAMNPYFQFFPSKSGMIDFKNTTAYKAVYIPGYNAPLLTDFALMENGFVYVISYNQELADSNIKFQESLNEILDSFTIG